MSDKNVPMRGSTEDGGGNGPAPGKRPRGPKSAAIALVAALLVLVAVTAGLQAKYDIFTRAANIFELGSSGTIEMEAGSYSGELKGGVIEGEGTFKFLSGEEYEGSWLNYRIDGWGELSYPGVGAYSGDYSDGKRSGEGTFKWENGDSYSGHWENDAPDGTGTYDFAEGGSLCGEFANGSFMSGTHTFSNETGDYSVTYESDAITGFNVMTEKGIYSFETGEDGFVDAKIELDSGLRYEGTVANGLFDGEGALTYPSEDTYEGTFSEGMRSGKGVYEWSDGASYDGSWKKDKENGKGTYCYPSGSKGEKLVGKFKAGKPDGYCTYYDKKGNHYKTKWEKGKCVKVWE